MSVVPPVCSVRKKGKEGKYLRILTALGGNLLVVEVHFFTSESSLSEYFCSRTLTRLII